MKNICFVNDNFNQIGGIERVACNIANELSNEFIVHLVSVMPRNKNDTPVFNLNKRVMTKNILFYKNIFLHLFPFLFYVFCNNIRVVVIEKPFLFHWSYVRFFHKTKIIFCDHSSLIYRLKSNAYGELGSCLKMAKNSHCIVTLTDANKQIYETQFCSKKIQCLSIPNWIEEKLYHPSDYCINSKKIIACGRLSDEKRFDLLIESFALISKKYPDWELFIYGSGENKNDLLSQISDLKLENVHLCGQYSSPDEAYNQAAFYVLSSKREGLPICLLEAKFYGLPIIAFDCDSGPREIVCDNINGFLVEQGNVRMLSDKMEELIVNSDKRVLFSKNSRQDIDKFAKQNILKKWRKLLLEII